jgi:hypothetical protein
MHLKEARHILPSELLLPHLPQLGKPPFLVHMVKVPWNLSYHPCWGEILRPIDPSRALCSHL